MASHLHNCPEREESELRGLTCPCPSFSSSFLWAESRTFRRAHPHLAFSAWGALSPSSPHFTPPSK